MKKHALIFAVCLSALSVNAMAENDGTDEVIKGSKNVITKEVSLETFTKVKATANVDVTFVQQAGQAKATILTSDNVMEYVTTTIADGVLTVGIKEGVSVSAKKLEVTVTAPSVSELENAGTGNLKCASINTETLTVTLTGKGDMDIKRVECQGICTANLKGTGDLDFGNVQCEDFVPTLPGSGEMLVGKLTGTNVKASVSGSGSIEMSGKVKFVDFNVSGLGSIHASMLQAENGNAYNTGSGSISAHVYGHLEQRNMGGGISNSK